MGKIDVSKISGGKLASRKKGMDIKYKVPYQPVKKIGEVKITGKKKK